MTQRRKARVVAVAAAFGLGLAGLGVAGIASGAVVPQDIVGKAATSESAGEPDASRFTGNAGHRGVYDFGLRLDANEKAKSADGRVSLIQQADGNLVLRNARNQPLWSTQTHGNPGAWTYFQHNGNLVVVDASGKKVLFTSETLGRAEKLAVQNDGNLVMYDGAGKAVWSSQLQTVSLFPGQRLGPNQYRKSADGRYWAYMQGDGNLAVGPVKGGIDWHSGTHGHPGASAFLQRDGNLVIHDAGGAPIWSSRTDGNSPGELSIQNDGNLVLYDSTHAPLWATNTSR